ncbi:hypothetical protein ACEPUD_06285 [Burkholderia ubonensis]|uniref:hypothetical protein n=1 Tax=Burkholderia ubonensis TaxID=101571 RepID=UPI00358EE609
MSLFSRRTAQIPKDDEQKKPTTTFFESGAAETATTSAKIKWRTDAGEDTARIGASKPEPPMNEQGQSVSRGKIEGGLRLNHLALLHAGQRDPLFSLSTHRNAHGDHAAEVERQKVTTSKKQEQEQRAWRGLFHLLDLFSR